MLSEAEDDPFLGVRAVGHLETKNAGDRPGNPLVWWHSVQDAVAAVSAQLLEGIGPFSSEHLREIRWSEKVHYRSMGVGRSTYRVGVQWQQGSEGAEGVRVIEFGRGELLFAAPLNDGDAFLCAHPMAALGHDRGGLG